jgi:hypothetical protein
MMSWYPNSTLHCMPLMQPTQYWYQNFVLSSLPHIKIKISPHAALPKFNIWIRSSNWVQLNPTQLLFLIHLSSTECLTSSPTHLYQKDERALPGDLVNLALLPPGVKCSVSHYPYTFPSLSLSLRHRSVNVGLFWVLCWWWHRSVYWAQ